MLIFASLALVDCQLGPEHSVGKLTTDSNFVCPPNREIKPCQCTVIYEIPTVQCNRIWRLKVVKNALTAKFQVRPIPYLKILNARFVGLPSRAFININMTRLHIVDAHLKYVAADAFAGLEKLLVLILQNARLLTIPSESLSTLSSLVTLSMPGNRFFSLEYYDLSTTRRLKYLSLAYNKLLSLDHGALPISLVTLALSNNYLTQLKRSIKDLSNLEWLFLNDNSLIEIEGEFDKLYSLRHLKLGRNRITKLGVAFRNLYSLQILELQYNSICELGDSMKHLSQLKTLNLSMNLLIQLHYSEFEGLTSLEYLYLSGNKLKTSNGALAQLPSLISLDLSRNYFRTFDFHELSSLSELKVVDMNENLIANPLSGTPSTKIYAIRLLLSKNRLHNLSDFMVYFPYLEDVDVSANYLTFLRVNDFTFSTSIEYINVQGKPPGISLK